MIAGMVATSAFLPQVAMVLAAGRGTRLGPASELIPKPLVTVGGRALIDHAFDLLRAAGVPRAVVNTHHRADLLERHIATRSDPAVMVSHEDQLLDTGGGVKKALPLLRDPVFFVVNTDLVWDADAYKALHRLGAAWDPVQIDVLLLLYPTVKCFGYRGQGDFFCDPLGRLRQRQEREAAPFLYTGLQIVHRRVFEAMPDGPFPMRRIWQRAERDGRSFGIVHDGEWLDAGTPERLAHARAEFGEQAQGRLL